MRSGPLRDVVRLQSYTTEADTFGQQVPTWTTVGTYRADINYFHGQEAVNALQQKAETTHRIEMRYIGPIDASMRILHTDPRTGVERVFNILDVEDVQNLKERYVIKAKEVTQPDTGG